MFSQSQTKVTNNYDFSVWCNQSGGSAIGSLGAGTAISNVMYNHVYTNGMRSTPRCVFIRILPFVRWKSGVYDQVERWIWHCCKSRDGFCYNSFLFDLSLCSQMSCSRILLHLERLMDCTSTSTGLRKPSRMEMVFSSITFSLPTGTGMSVRSDRLQLPKKGF